MATMTLRGRPLVFKVGFGILLFFTVGNVFGHIGLLLTHDEFQTGFMAWAALDFLAATILWFAYRHGDKWAWYVMWAFVVPYALVIIFNPSIGPIYLGESIAMALGQLLTYRGIFARK